MKGVEYDDTGRGALTNPKPVASTSRVVTTIGSILFCLLCLRYQSSGLNEHLGESLETSLKVKAKELPAFSNFYEKNGGNTTFLLPTQPPSSTRHQRFICQFDKRSTLNVSVFPDFIIIGAQKAGTSAISALLETSQSILRSAKFEAHFWDFAVLKRINSKTHKWTEQEKCRTIKKYRGYFHMKHAKRDTIIFEKTPRLLALPQVPRLIREVLHPHVPKLLITLRDPADRFYSSFKMEHEAFIRGRNKSASEILEYVEQKVAQDILKGAVAMRNAGLIDKLPAAVQNWNHTTIASKKKKSNTSVTCKEKCRLVSYRQRLARGIYVHQIKKYMEYFELGTHMMVIQYENFTRNRSDGLNEILRFVGAPLHNLTEEELQADLSPVPKKLNAKGQLKVDTSTHPERVMFPPLPQRFRDILNTLYKPYNTQLESLLGEEWRNVWSA